MIKKINYKFLVLVMMGFLSFSNIQAQDLLKGPDARPSLYGHPACGAPLATRHRVVGPGHPLPEGKTVETFGGIDILVNNASAIHLAGTVATPMKRYDLMHSVNTRGTFACSQACIPHLKNASNPHILNLSPPLNMEAKWFAPHVAYTMAKFGMSMCVLGMAEELKPEGIAVNALWPRTVIATAAVQNLLGGDEVVNRSRTPEIMGDAAYTILTKPSREFTGNFCIDDDVLRSAGVTDFDKYQVTPGVELLPDFFI